MSGKSPVNVLSACRKEAVLSRLGVEAKPKTLLLLLLLPPLPPLFVDLLGDAKFVWWAEEEEKEEEEEGCADEEGEEGV